MIRSAVKAIRRAVIRSKDAVKYSSRTANVLLAGTNARLRYLRNDAQRAKLLMRAYRLAETQSTRRALRVDAERYLKGTNGNIWREQRIGWERYPRAAENSHVNRSIILKAPRSNGEKGVLLVMFEYNWLRLLANVKDLGWLGEHFDIILSTSWSPTDYALLALALQSLPGTIFVQACNYGEIPWIEEFSPRLKCLPCIACDWINPDCYQPKPYAQRQTDILVVANWAPFKRHWQLFDALRRMPQDLRITMIGQEEGGHTLAMVRDQAALFGGKQDINFVENITIDEVTRHQCDSKVSLILSRREGCCVAAVESLFADSPLGMMHDAHVGPKAYINKDTGVLLTPDRMDLQLQRFLDNAGGFHARAWAIENISCRKSISKVNALLRSHAELAHAPWTTDLKTPYWRPYPIFLNPSDREEMRPVYQDLCARFPEVFEPDLLEKGSS
jgi:glycosyltransferase involved in cell wall biosynthesis